MHPDIIRKYDLTISTDNVMVHIGPPGLVTLFLSLCNIKKGLLFGFLKILPRGLVGLVTVCRVGKLTGVLTGGEAPL